MSHEQNDDYVGTASFVFVARNKDDHTKAIAVPRISFEGEDDVEKCELRYELGKYNQFERKKFSAVHYLIFYFI